jgi:hypothetical protein
MLVVAAALAGPGVAAAAPANGVHIDPGSPAGKQYAIPLGQARAGGAQGNAAAVGSSQLFGAGITSANTGPTSRDTAPVEARSAQRASRPRHAPSSAAAHKRAPVAIIPVSKLVSASGNSSGVWWMLAGGLLVLALGGLGGALLARRS